MPPVKRAVMGYLDELETFLFLGLSGLSDVPNLSFNLSGIPGKQVAQMNFLTSPETGIP